MRIRGPAIFSVCVAAVLLLAGGAGAAERAPAYARLALPWDGSRTVALMLTAEEGSQVPNVLYLDLNNNGEFEENEKQVALRPGTQTGPFQSCSFRPVAVPFASAPPSSSYRVSVNWISFAQPGKETPEELTQATVMWTVTDGGKQLGYAAGGTLKTAASSEQAPLSGVGGPLTMRLQAQPPKGNVTKTGVAVTLGWPNLDLYVVPTSRPVHLEIRNAAGKLVHQHDGQLRDMGMG